MALHIVAEMHRAVTYETHHYLLTATAKLGPSHVRPLGQFLSIKTSR